MRTFYSRLYGLACESALPRVGGSLAAASAACPQPV